MDLRDYYRQRAASITDEDMRKAALFLSEHVGRENAASKQELTLAIYGKQTDSTERKAREVLNRLVTECGVAVGSNSGTSGYYIIETDQERSEVIAELKSRSRELNDRAFSLFNIKLPSPTEGRRMQGGLF
jgi:hypothetical protein